MRAPRASISSEPGTGGAGSLASAGTTASPLGLRSSSTCIISAPETPSIVQWWIFV